MADELFTKLRSINVNEHVEKLEKSKKGPKLSYLSWTWAWDAFKQACPDATYTIWRNEQGLPYAYDPNTRYMVYTSVTAGGTTHEMWLPVMNGACDAMKSQPYEITNKYKEKRTVDAATMFEINKTIMRCLVKNLAMFGLGLYIYAGEDLPEDDESEENASQDASPAEPVNLTPAGVNMALAPNTPKEIFDAIEDFKFLGGNVEKALITFKYTDINQPDLNFWKKLAVIKKNHAKKEA